MTINNLKKANQANQTKFYEIVDNGKVKNNISNKDKKINESFILFLSKLTDRKNKLELKLCQLKL
jgi:hypothetical protein